MKVYTSQLGPTDGGEQAWKQIRIRRLVPVLLIHLLCFGVFWVGISSAALLIAVALYFVRMFFITAFYHRYFSHRAFRMHRVTQMVATFLCTTCAQRGPLWWAAHHRGHHQHSDESQDIHSPVKHGVFWSHMGWIYSDGGTYPNYQLTRDFAHFGEIRWLNKYHIVGPIALAVGLYFFGELLASSRPNWGTNGWQCVVWGFGVSTTLLYHGTFSINSLAHLFGSRRYQTRDDSRNNLLLALITLGEGWHNNHHYCPAAVRQGFYWWEIDLTYYVLWALSKLGLIWDLRHVPARAYAAVNLPDSVGFQKQVEA